jgi:hypothetical protein
MVDCAVAPASLAMTAKYDFAFPRRDAPELCCELLALENRGRRECRTLGASAAARVV